MSLDSAIMLLVISVPFFALSVWAIVNAAQKDFGSTGAKIMWCLIAGIPYIGALIYLLFGIRKGKKVD